MGQGHRGNTSSKSEYTDAFGPRRVCAADAGMREIIHQRYDPAAEYLLFSYLEIVYFLPPLSTTSGNQHINESNHRPIHPSNYIFSLTPLLSLCIFVAYMKVTRRSYPTVFS